MPGVEAAGWQAALLALLAGAACAQETSYGVAVPVVITGNALSTNAKQTDDGLVRSDTAGFRLVASPALHLGAHWFLYSSLDLYSSSYFTGKHYALDGKVGSHVMQAFVGYSSSIKAFSLLFKVGQLSSAFGSAPVEYDDSKMPLLAPPQPYLARINLRPDQVPCGAADLLAQRNGYDVAFHCGGAESDAYGFAPVTLYGLPGIEAQASGHRLDVRLQLTNSSPANPQRLAPDNQSPQLTIGAGYTLHSGLRLGFSRFSGPYLDSNLRSILPAATSFRSFDASGSGIDVQWARGGWSTEGEWQRFYFGVPGFLASPTVYACYGQAKKIISPRTFVAARFSSERFGRVTDHSHVSADSFQPSQRALEFSAGFRINGNELLKAGVLLANNGLTPQQDPAAPPLVHAFEIQLVTDITRFSHAFR